MLKDELSRLVESLVRQQMFFLFPILFPLTELSLITGHLMLIRL